MLTGEQLHVIMPALPTAKREALLPFLQLALTEFFIDSAARHAAFLAQLAHESGQLRFMQELWGPTAAQQRYEPPSTLAAALGNTESGDGERFRGRGPIQITGRANYRRYGGLLSVDLESHPQLAARHELAFRIAGLFWNQNGLNELADEASPAAFKKITRRINGGFNGLADRERLYAVACATLGVTQAPARGGSRGRSRTSRRAPAAQRFERGAEAIARASRRASAKTPRRPRKRRPRR
jgi:putative chitinase